MTRKTEALYQPPGAAREALCSYYVRHVVQSAIDEAFKLGPKQRPESKGEGPS